MHIETRGSRQYLYKTIREGKRVRKVYLGTGAGAQQLMALQTLGREKKEFEKKIAEERQAALWPLQQRMDLLRTEATLSMRGLYLAAGYYRSRCRHWRRRKRMDSKAEKPSNIGSSEPGQPPPTTDAREDRRSQNQQLAQLCAAIKAGQNHRRPQLRKLLLQESPKDIVRIGSLTNYVVDQWSRLIAPDNPVMRESIALNAQEERKALAPPGSTYVEQVIADRLVLAKLQQSFHELRMTAIADKVDAAGSKVANAMEKRLQVSTRELREATKHYQKSVELRAEISPPRPQSGIAALKVYNPDQKRKSA